MGRAGTVHRVRQARHRIRRRRRLLQALLEAGGTGMTSTEYAEYMAILHAKPLKPRAKRFTGPVAKRKAKDRADLAWAGPKLTPIHLDRKAIGKPRMTQRDKWATRKCVLAYRAFADELRAAAGDSVPPASRVVSILIVARFATTDKSLWGRPYRQKPDGDNILKACTDPLWKDDEKLGDLTVVRMWGGYDALGVAIETGEMK